MKTSSQPSALRKLGTLLVTTSMVLQGIAAEPPPPPAAPTSTNPEAGGKNESALQSLEMADGRLTSRQQPLSGAVGILDRLKPKRYLLHAGYFDGQGRVIIEPDPTPIMGLIAQETIQVVPEAVFRPADPSRDFWMLDYETFVPLLIKATQEQQSDIRSHETKIEEQKRKITELEAKVAELEQQTQKLQGIVNTIDDGVRSAFAALRSEVKSLTSKVEAAGSKSSCSCSK